jgi:hypothetical protein
MNKIVDVATLVLIVAGITVLVRPNSQGPKFVSAVGDSFSTVIRAATAF